MHTYTLKSVHILMHAHLYLSMHCVLVRTHACVDQGFTKTLKVFMFVSPFFLAVCPTALEGNNTGVIYSPSFPNDYPNNMKCNWTIAGKYPYNNLVLNFTFFDLRNRCHDKVIVKDGQHPSSTKLGLYCQGDKKAPFVVSPTGRYAKVEFMSQSGSTGQGFLVFYKFLYSRYRTPFPTAWPTQTPYPRYTTRPYNNSK